MSNSAQFVTPAGAMENLRVRTPGKYIVVMLAVAVLLVSLSTSILQSRTAVTRAGALSYVKEGGLYYAPMEPILVDMAPDRAGRITYLKLTPVIVVDSDAERDALAAQQLEIRERMTVLLRALAPEDIAGDAGMARVKDELKRRVNLILGEEGAREVIINDLIIQ